MLLTCCIKTANAQTTGELWNEAFVSTVQDAACISYSLTVDGVYHGEPFNLDTVCHVLSTANGMWHTNGSDGLKNLWISRDTFCLFNRRTDDIVYGTTWKDSTHTERSSEFNVLIYPQQVAWGWISGYLPLYFLQWDYSPEDLVPESHNDSVWDGRRYWAFQVVDHGVGTMDGDTFVPNDDTILYFVNQSTRLVERVDIHTHNKMHEQSGYERFLFHDVKALDAMPPLGKEWDMDNAMYAKTPKYDIKQHVPASLTTMRPPKRYKVTDRPLLDYPLLDIHGDTVSVGQMSGWLLIDFFQYGCKPCAQFHRQIQEESKDDGLCILEEHGVKVVCILPSTGLSDAFKKYADRFGLQTRAYCARELAPLVENLHYYPKYYLISPDKEIVLEDEHDATVILNKIAEYEKSR